MKSTLALAASLFGATSLCSATPCQLAPLVEINKPFTALQNFCPFTADLDADGLSDIVLRTREPEGLSWIRQTSLGEFARPATFTSTPHQVASTVLADFTGDGFDDIVLLTNVGPVYLVRGSSSGFIAVPADAGDGAGTQPIAADIDGDGDLDLVTSIEVGSVISLQFRLNDGAGVFGATQPVPHAPITTDLPQIASSDLNSDGRADLLIAADEEVWTFLGQAGGSMAAGPPIPVPGYASYDIEMFDVTGDGLEDLGLLRFGVGAQFAMWERTGPLSFSPLSSFPGGFPGPAHQLEAADIDLDGDLDAVMTTSKSRVGAFINSGGGQFGAFNPYPDAFVANGAPCPHLGDLDGDRAPDLISISADSAGFSVRWSRNELSSFSAPAAIVRSFSLGSAFDLADLDGDGSPEVLGRVAPSGSLGAFRESPSGNFEWIELTPAGAAFVYHLGGSDLDADGLGDVVSIIEPGELRAYRSINPFELGVPVSLGPVDSSAGFASADLDGDGLKEILAAVQPNRLVAFPQLPGFDFGTQTTIFNEAGARIRQFEPVDFDQDGLTDIVLSYRRQAFSIRSLAWLRNNGASFDLPVQIASHGGDFLAFAIGDIDSDGDLDIAYSRAGTDGVNWVESLGLGQFSSPSLLAESGVSTVDVDLADVDQDGDMDVIASDFELRTLIYRNDGALPFERGATVSAELANTEVVDIDSDGDLDVVLQCAQGFDVSLRRSLQSDVIGSTYCGPAIQNSAGSSGEIIATGNPNPAVGSLQLLAQGLPEASLGIFLTSRQTGSVFPVPGSDGRLCLGGSIGRFVGPGQVLNSGVLGLFSFEVDLLNLPTPNGLVAGLPGETWHFQAWFRDVSSLPPFTTSNFTNGVSVVLQ